MKTIDKNTYIPLKVKRIIDALNKEGHKAYLVGGCVRDILLGETPHDYDICTSALPEETINTLINNHIRYSTIGYEYGTIEAYIGEDEFEITTFRSESDYLDGRHPSTVKYETDIIKDLSRRDFTINAMALDVNTFELIDPFNGKEDVENKIIRAVGNPDDRLEEDSIRMLRAIRFSIRFGYKIDDTLEKSIKSHVKLVHNLSKERITKELTKILSTNKPITEQFIRFSSLIAVIFPEIKPCIGFNQNNKYHMHNVYEHMLAVTDNCNTTDYTIKFAALFHDIGKPDSYTTDEEGYGHFYKHPEVSEKITDVILRTDLKLTAKESEKIKILVKYHDIDFSIKKRSVKRILNRVGEENFSSWLILKQADIDDHIIPEGSRYIKDISELKTIYEQIKAEQECFSLKDLEINGRDLISELKLKPGRHIGKILNILLEEVINEDISNTKDKLLNEARSIYNKNSVLWTNQDKHKEY